MIGRIKTSVVLIIMLFNIVITYGQSIRGKIIDKNTRQQQPAIQVSLKNTDFSVFTNGLGNFEFTDVSSGNYTIVALVSETEVEITEVTVDGNDVDLGALEVLMLSPNAALTDITIIDVSDLAGIENENDNFSGVLSAGRDPFVSASTFNLSAGRFRPRGYFNEDTEMYMNGMLMNDQDDGRVLWTAWNGLNDVLRNRSNLINLNESDYTFGGIGGATFIDLRASSQRKEAKITYANSNRTFQHRLMGTYSTGLMKNGWAISASASHTYGDQGYIKGTHIQANSYFLSVDKKINDKHLLNFVAFGSPQRRGRSTGAIQEMYDLSGSNYYNPNWGYQNGEVRNSREYKINQPVTMLRHDWNISKRTTVMSTLGYQFGSFGSTRLDWYEAADPRPDYYRKLPSFAETEEGKQRITEFYQASEENRQLNWDAMYQANANRSYTIENANGIQGNSVSGKLAAYILESENYDNQKLTFNSVINSQLNSNIALTAGLQYLNENVHYYRRLEDLLGADFYIDYNRFALRDFPNNVNAAQNDVNRPNRILKEGDIFGHDYDINSSKAVAWGQGTFKTSKVDYFLGLSLANQSFYRDGNTRVGLFPESSFGKSETQTFFNYGVKGGVTYKFDGRNYLVLNGSYRTRAPFANESFVSPRVRDQIASNLTNEKITAFDVSYLARYTNFKARVSAFYTNFEDKITNDVFYHEEFRTFVNYLMTGIDRRHMGVEFGLEYNLTSKISLTAAGSVGEYIHTSRPLVTISRDNSAEDFVQNRVVFIEDFYVTGMPQMAGTVGIAYRSSKYWNWNLNVNGFSRNYLSFNPDRRTIEGVSPLNPETQSELLSKVRDQERLPDAITVDLSVGKSYRFKNGAFINVNLNAGNILNNTNFITGGFEQLRFDFVEKDVDRFPPRYFYSFGLNYNLNVAYIFPR